MTWMSSVECPRCHTCEVPLLPMVTDADPRGTAFWCSICKVEYVEKKRPAPEATEGGPLAFRLDLGPPDVAEAKALRTPDAVPYVMRVEPDGTVSLQVGGADGPRAVLPTLEAVRDLSSALTWLGRGAQGRREQLRGVNRWSFHRAGDVVHASLLDERRPLAAYRVGRLKHGETGCWACRIKIAVGITAYRPIVEPWCNSRVAWKEARFCARCVEGAPVAKVFGPLRSIDGGKAGGTRA